MLFANIRVAQSAENRTFQNVEVIPYNRVGVVLGTAKYRRGGGINLYFDYRIKAVVALFKNNKIDLVLVSGDNSSKAYNEPDMFKKALIEMGIPEDKIVLDFAGFRTLDSVVRAKCVFGLKKFTVISQKFHNERAIYLAQHYDIDVVGFNAKDVSQRYGFKTRVREYFARSKAVIDILIGVEPKFLGEQIDLNHLD
ncbi:protein SanA [Brumimicrobium salinarum]|uniref:Protein SanA n=2 Tax=Brumimicrobium salinarum TaxID=2058658 RepID=A0A2I0QZQ9_9FLAO|nr:protein SanA [Brumimicrobium salinarum]